MITGLCQQSGQVIPVVELINTPLKFELHSRLKIDGICISDLIISNKFNQKEED